MKKREQEFTTRFLNYARSCFLTPTAFEIKQVEGHTFNLKEFKEHQRNALRAAKHGRFTYKIPDTGYLNPFDAVLFTKMDAYLVISYPDFFVAIDIDDVPESGSLSEDHAKEKATYVGRLPFSKVLMSVTRTVRPQ